MLNVLVRCCTVLVRNSVCLAIAALSCHSLAFADAASTAKSRISITKLAPVNLETVGGSIVAMGTVDSTSASKDSYVCLSPSPWSPPHTVELAQSTGTTLKAAEGEGSILYTASLSKQANSSSTLQCENWQTELKISVSAAAAGKAPSGFYSDNLVLMVVVE